MIDQNCSGDKALARPQELDYHKEVISHKVEPANQLRVTKLPQTAVACRLRVMC